MLSKIEEAIIPEHVKEALERIPDKRTNTRKTFEPWQDRVILEYYETKPLPDLGKICGCSEVTIRKRYKELKENE